MRESREYSAKLAVDGSFEIIDVIPGTYELRIAFVPHGKITLDAADGFRRILFNGLIREVVAPESDDRGPAPLELGVWKIDLKKP
jgi:hypothetical protein